MRAIGAAVAVDVAGAGYSSLHQVMMLRPDFVKVDRAIVTRMDGDETRRAIVEALSKLAGELDASIVAEGVERLGEIDALLDLGVPLAQGYALARPARELPEVQERVRAYVRERSGSVRSPDTAVALADHPPVLARDATRDEIARVFLVHPGSEWLVLLDGRGAPAGLVGREAFLRGEGPGNPSLRVLASAELGDVARRAATRPREERFHPVPCCDGDGRFAGLVPVDRLLRVLAS
jgi:hypothetical protein